MPASPFGRVGVAGFGLIGGSIALAAKRRWPSVVITVCDPAPVTLEAVTQGLVAAVVTTPAELGACDLIVIATPVLAVPGVIKELHAVSVTGLVTDVGGTKRAVMDAARHAPGLTFVGGHPLASAETGGLAAARADLFDGKPWLLVSGASAPDQSRDLKESMLASFVVGLGARPEWTDAITHDRVMAHVSHAPKVVSEALAPTSQHLHADDWEGILESNADFISDALTALAAKLPASADTLTNTPAVRDVMDRARALKAGGR